MEVSRPLMKQGKMSQARLEQLISDRARRTTDPPISWMLEKALTVPGLISLAAGFVDQQSLPSDVTWELAQEILNDEATQKACLQYSCTEGDTALREAVLTNMAAKNGITPEECSISARDIMITTGSQQMLFLLADVLLNEGDIIFVEDPTYFVFLNVLEGVGARVMGIPTEKEDGIDLDAFRVKLKALETTGDIDKVKAVYIMTYFMNPKGTCFSREKHAPLLELVQQYWKKGHPFYIIEDAAYQELAFANETFPCIKTLDPENQYVIYTNSFSKAFAPGVRTGYGILPSQLTVHVARQKGNLDFGSPSLGQFLIRKALETGRYQQHVRKLQETYRRKSELALQVIDHHFPQGLNIIRPKGGLYIWVQLPQGCETGADSRLFQEAMKRKVLYVPGELCYAREPGVEKDKCSMRLCYAFIDQDALQEGLTRLGESITAVLT